MPSLSFGGSICGPCLLSPPHFSVSLHISLPLYSVLPSPALNLAPFFLKSSLGLSFPLQIYLLGSHSFSSLILFSVSFFTHTVNLQRISFILKILRFITKRKEVDGNKNHRHAHTYTHARTHTSQSY